MNLCEYVSRIYGLTKSGHSSRFAGTVGECYIHVYIHGEEDVRVYYINGLKSEFTFVSSYLELSSLLRKLRHGHIY